jgi:hypothetical protein
MKHLRSRLNNAFVAILMLMAVSTPATAEPDSTGLASFVENGMKLWHVPGTAFQ